MSLNTDLKKLFWRGWVAGPQEGEEAFYQRVTRATAQSPIPLGKMEVDWVPVTYSDKGLRLWEGGCSWIGDATVQIQLRAAFARSSSLYKIYSKEELLSHEAVHAVRVCFTEPMFEEVLAYQTSSSSWRKVYGSLFRSSRESLLFMGCVALSLFSPWGGLFLLVLLGGLFVRAYSLYRLYKRAEKKLKGLTTEPPFHWMLALTDKEILFFAKSTPQEILTYISQQSSIRWRQLKNVFLLEIR